MENLTKPQRLKNTSKITTYLGGPIIASMGLVALNEQWDFKGGMGMVPNMKVDVKK